VSTFKAFDEVLLLKLFTFLDDGFRAVALEFSENTCSIIYVSYLLGKCLLEAVRRNHERFSLHRQRIVDPGFYLFHKIIKVSLMRSAQTREGPFARTTTFDLVFTLLFDVISLS
jgi:hypothetical protein